MPAVMTRDDGKRGLLREVDFHVLYLVVMLFLLVTFSGRFPVTVPFYAVLPQFLIFFRVRENRKGAVKYLWCNEGIVLLAVVADFLLDV